MTRNEILTELLDDIKGFVVYEGYIYSPYKPSQLSYSADNLVNNLASGEVIEFKDTDQGGEPKKISFNQLISELIKHEYNGETPENLNDFSIEQLQDLSERVQQYDCNDAWAIWDICFYGEITYC